MFNRKQSQKTPPRELTPWELAQQSQREDSTITTDRDVKKKRVKPGKNKKKSKGITNATLLKGIFMVCAGGSLDCMSPLSKVSEIEVVGLEQVPIELVQEKDGIVKGQSIWTVLANRYKTAESLKEASPKIKNASVELLAWNKMRLNIEENPAVGYYRSEDNSYELLADGQVIETENNHSSKDYPELVQFTQESQYQSLAKQLNKVSSGIIKEIAQIQYPNDSKNHLKIYLKMKDGNRVIGTLKDIGDKLPYYPSISKQLNGKKGTVDMEVGIYFTPDTTIQ